MATRKKPQLELADVPRPAPIDRKHIYQVQLAFIDDADLDIEAVRDKIAVLLAREGLEVLAERGHKADNLTRRAPDGGGGMQLIGVTGYALKKTDTVLRVLRRKR